VLYVLCPAQHHDPQGFPSPTDGNRSSSLSRSFIYCGFRHCPNYPGVVLQNSKQPLLNLQGEFRWVAHGIFFASLMGMMWGMRALRSFDMFGIQPILTHIRASRVRTVPLTIRGPYRWVRHPLYFFILVLIWCCPDVTMDRLLFNLLFTAWIVLGTLLEERDLVTEFGESYLNYQGKVPMLIPWKLHKPFPSWMG